MSILIKNGRLLDPATKTDAITDLYLADGVVKEIGKDLEKNADQAIDATGCYVMPGLIDLHVHFRDPGLEYKENIETGSKAAARGGVTTVVAMPNTKPVADNASVITYVKEKAEKTSQIHVLQAGAITVGQEGKELADIEGMAKAGMPAISEDGKSVADAGLYLEAMKLAAKLNIPVLAHCEDMTIRGKDGCMNLGDKSEELGLPGISNSVEDVIVARDIVLAKEAGARLHLCHCSTKDSVEMIRAAKRAGLPVSGEVCPHHFTLTTDDIDCDDPNYKMNPPLRTREDVEALIRGLQDGTMEAISTDHAPHAPHEKSGSMRDAAFGIVGLETSVALTITELVDKGILTPMQMAEKMSYHPAKILGIDKGSLEVGKAADVVIIDPRAEYVIDVNTFVSKGKNTPFHGKKVKGKVRTTICDGKIIYQEEN